MIIAIEYRECVGNGHDGKKSFTPFLCSLFYFIRNHLSLLFCVLFRFPSQSNSRRIILKRVYMLKGFNQYKQEASYS